MPYWLKRLLTRPRVLFRARSKLGWAAALRLVRIRFGDRRKTYQIRVPQFPHPVILRGGNSSDAVVLYEILVMDEYGFIGDLGSPSFIVDAGANVGIMSLYFLTRYPTARLISVEPDPVTFQLCRKNLEPFSHRVRLVHGAVWSQDGSLSLVPSEQEWATGVRPAGSGESGDVPAFGMRSLMAPAGGQVDLLKLDIEGSEREVFATGVEEWLPGIRNLVIEVHTALYGKECEDRLFDALRGYEYEMRREDYLICCRNLRPSEAGS
jgi:FkbM family methyltransferase